MKEEQLQYTHVKGHMQTTLWWRKHFSGVEIYDEGMLAKHPACKSGSSLWSVGSLETYKYGKQRSWVLDPDQSVCP
jgi:hypothetical protein